MKALTLVIVLGLTQSLLLGCSSQVEDYVKDTKPDHFDTPATTTPAPSTVNSPMTLKLTPGKMNGTGGGMAVQATVTTTNQSFALGSDKALVLTISRTRVTPQ